MANEAEIVELLGNGGDPISVTVADGTAITKGTIMKLSDPRTGAASSADGDKPIGIAAADKVANDGSTTLSVYTNGIFLLTTSAAVGVGIPVAISGANTINQTASGEMELGVTLGYALESASASGEQIEVKLRL